METGTTQTTPATAAETTQTTEATAAAAATAAAPKEEPKGSMVTEDAPKPEDKSKDQPEKPAVPEKYELKLPKDSKLEAGYLDKVSALAKEKGWSNERAQEYIDDRHAAVTEFQTMQQTELQTLNTKTWKEELMNDPDFGGKHFEVNGHLAHKAAERFGGKEFADQIKAMQLNHHPMFFRFLARVGKAMESDSFVEAGKTNSTGQRSYDEKLKAAYPSMYKPKE